MKTPSSLRLAYRTDGWWRDEGFLDDLRRNATDRPGQVAVLQRSAASGQVAAIDYAALAQLTDAMARGLIGLGVRPGEYIGLQLPGCLEVLPLALACIKTGIRLAPVPPEYRRSELEYMLLRTEARGFITVAELHGGRPAHAAAGIARELGLPERIVVIGEGGPPGAISFHGQFLGSGDSGGPGSDGHRTQRRPLGPDEPFLLLFTSGTTGENKGAMHSQNTLYAGIRGYAGALGLDDTLVKTTPHTSMHYVGLVQGLLAPLVLGGTAVCADTWEPAVTLELIERCGVTMFYGSPPYVRELLEAQRDNPRDTSSLRYIVAGSAPVPPSLLAEVSQTLGARMYSLWGMSENGPVTLTRPDDPQDWPAHSDGRPTGGMEIRIDPIAGRSDGAGPLWVRGPAQCLGYYKRDEAYAADLDDAGWFNTGDLARDDGRGGIRIVGRTKDIIIYRSANVPVLDIETALGRHAKVRDVALVGIPDPAVDERVCAVVTVSGPEPPTLEELRDFLRDAGISSWCWPERLEVVEAMPRTPTGKIRKIELRKRYAAV